MKKVLGILVIGLLLSACSSGATEEVDSSQNIEETKIEEKTSPSQEELNIQLKDDAVQADFVELNVDNPPDGKKVYIEGEVSLLTKGTLEEFVLTSEEESGKGMYKVELLSSTDFEYADGDQVRVYGAVNGKDEVGMPKISATILEKQ